MAGTDGYQFLSEAGDVSVVNRRHVLPFAAGGLTAGAMLAAALLTPHTSAVYVPLVQVQAERPVAAYAYDPPPGYRCLGIDQETMVDAAGVRWHHCEAADEKGQIIWAEGRSSVQQTGHGGPGRFERGVDGWGYVTDWSYNDLKAHRQPIEGWKAW